MLNNAMAQHLFEYSFNALGGKNEIKIFAKDPDLATKISDAIVSECRRIETKFSRYNSDSIVTKINSAAGLESTAVDPETAGLFDYAAACYQQSEELFDITSGILRRVWNFKNKSIPTNDEILEVLPLIGWNKVEWKNQKIRLPLKGMEIDLGGIGKEYAVDRCFGIAWESGIRSGFVNLGGDLRVLGPRPDESPWSIGIQNPREMGTAIAQVKLTGGALATSGDYEKFIELNGVRYCHIMNPKTGWPVQGVKSVTVMTDSCLIAGTLSTIAMLFGPKRGQEFLESQAVKFLMY